ncbi:MAG: hypothetical protein J3K34DRAFT_403263 [Monoraphidium minutum]|nr:MAG: hypothetical protein J3K34DRAFT_403263 [Monoraphidium minutum]
MTALSISSRSIHPLQQGGPRRSSQLAPQCPGTCRRAGGAPRRPRVTPRAGGGGGGGGSGEDASAIPDALPVAGPDTDWRAFRARLAAMEGAPGAGGSFKDSKWAHAVPVPETGCVLLAHPSMFGISQSYFRLAAILILECSDTGALGVILNRPTQHSLREVRFTADEGMDAFAGNTLYMGGDVGESSVIVITSSAAVEGATEIAAGIRVATVAAATAAVRAGRASPDDFRFFAQYSGWGPGQLQREVKAGVWFVAAVSSPLALDEQLAKGPELWHEVLTTMGGPHAELSQLVRESEARMPSSERLPGEEGA